MAEKTGRYDKSVARGGKLRTETSTHNEKQFGLNYREGLMGKEMGGGPRWIGHSITDGGQVVKK